MQVNARLSSGIVKLGSPAALILEVEGADDVQLAEPPLVEGLRFGRPGNPGRQQSFSFINGQRSGLISSTAASLSFAASSTTSRGGMGLKHHGTTDCWMRPRCTA